MQVRKAPFTSLIALSLGLCLLNASVAFGAHSKKHASKEKSSHSKSESKASKLETGASDSDESSLKAQISALSKSIADGDIKTTTSFWAPDGDYIAVDGVIVKGKDQLEKMFSALATINGKHQIDLIPQSTRMISSNVAMSEGIVKRNNGDEGPMPETRFSMVFVKRDGKWLISRATETPFVNDTADEPLKALSWMVGEWSAEGSGGGSVHMKAEWVANKNFITCSYVVKKSADAQPVESKQVIGWDPRSEQLVSWHFDSNGGFGYGTWMNKGKEWMVDATGVDRDGSTTNATNVISIADTDNFTWQSVNRSVNGVGFNDTAPLKVHRLVR
jgi:uncharacterized protein (TIGR02246 family)